MSDIPGGRLLIDESVLEALRAWLIGELQRSGSLPDAPEDLVGKVMLRVLVKSQEEEIEAPFAYAWMVLQNLVRDEIRMVERAKKALETLARTRPVQVEAESNGHLENSELVRKLLQRSGLSPLQEKVVRMVYLHGMTLSEVGRELSRDPGTIAQHRCRALEKMARFAAAMGVEP